MGVMCLMGQPDRKRYRLPHQLDECMKKFFPFAQGQGLSTCCLARIPDSIPHDAYSFREDSTKRKGLTEHMGHQLRVLIAEHSASYVLLDRFDEAHRASPIP